MTTIINETISFPSIISFENHQDIDVFLNGINQISTKRISVHEVGCDGGYVAVFYVGRIPSADVMKFLARNNPYVHDQDICGRK